LSRLAVEQALETEQRGDARQAGGMLGRRFLAHLDAEQDVLRDVQVREQGIGLEHHRDAPPCRRQPGHIDAVDEDLAGHRNVEPGDQPQGGGLAASRRTEEDDEAARRRNEADVPHGIAAPPLAADVLELDRRHGPFTGRKRAVC
jgi:hypothetical protein